MNWGYTIAMISTKLQKSRHLRSLNSSKYKIGYHVSRKENNDIIKMLTLYTTPKVRKKAPVNTEMK